MIYNEAANEQFFRENNFYSLKKDRFWESLWEENTLPQQHTLISLHLSELTSSPAYFILSMDQEKSFVNAVALKRAS